MMPAMELLEHTLCEMTKESVDADKGVIRNVKVLGRVSQRGRTYSEKALRDCCRLYEGVGVNLDHPPESTPGKVRAFFEQIGELQNCRLEGDGVRADLAYMKTHPGAPVLLECAERFPKRIGLSHNASGSKVRRNGEVIVESVDQVRSVDIVTRAATNSGLFESEDDDMAKTKTRTVKEILADAPEGRWTKVLMEMEPAVVPPEMEVETEEAADPAAEVKAALLKGAQAVLKKVFEGDLSREEGMAEIEKMLDMGDEAGGGADGEADTGADAMTAEMESLRDRLNRQDAKNLLLENNREPKQVWIDALADTPEAKRQALMESFPEKTQKKDKSRRPSQSPPLMESDDDGEYTPSKDPKDLVRRCRLG